MYKKDITDIISNWVQQMEFPVCIYTITGSGPYILEVDNTYHAQVGITITIGGNPYIITAFTCNTLTVTGPPITVDTFNMNSPDFVHGTAIQTDTDLANQPDKTILYPLVWLWNSPDVLKENFERDPGSAIERESDIKLFFLTRADFTLSTEPIKVAAVQPMHKLLENFLSFIDAPFRVPAVYKWEQTALTKIYTKFGVWITKNGVEKSLFVDELSGCELDLKLILYRPPD